MKHIIFKTIKEVPNTETGWEDFETIPKDTVCIAKDLEGSPVIMYKGKRICDTDSNFSKEYFVQVYLEERKGYDITDYDRTGMLEIQRIDEENMFESDEEAVEQAIKDGIKIIPVDELPSNFDRRYLGWVDTEENRKCIANYCSMLKED